MNQKWVKIISRTIIVVLVAMMVIGMIAPAISGMFG